MTESEIGTLASDASRVEVLIATVAQNVTQPPSRDIPFDKLVLRQSNVRRIDTGISVAKLSEDIARLGLQQSLNVRPVLNAQERRLRCSRARWMAVASRRCPCL